MRDTLELPGRVASVRALALQYQVSIHELMCCILATLNPEFIIEGYYPRSTPISVRKVANEFCRQYAWTPFPLNRYYACDDIEVTGTALVLYNAKGY